METAECKCGLIFDYDADDIEYDDYFGYNFIVCQLCEEIVIVVDE